MKVVFRVDSGNHIGIGHLIRCLTLAEAFTQKSAEVIFITKNHLGHMTHLIPKCYQTFILAGGWQMPLQNPDDYRTWIGESSKKDQEETLNIIKSISMVDIVVFDHYSIDADYESLFQEFKVVVIDDLMNRRHQCNFLIDQNITAESKTYTALCQGSSPTFLIGCDYAILRKEYFTYRENLDSNQANRPIQKILVFFGGADQNSNTLILAKAIASTENHLLKWKIILNENHPNYNSIKNIISENNLPIELVSFVNNMALEMLHCDLFIGAAGVTNWERAALGVASAVISVASNQRANCFLLEEKKCIHYLGSDKDMNQKKWENFLQEINKFDRSYWKNLRENNWKLVDAKGVDRITLEVLGN